MERVVRVDSYGYGYEWTHQPGFEQVHKKKNKNEKEKRIKMKKKKE
jgi:hypothetical protein